VEGVNIQPQTSCNNQSDAKIKILSQNSDSISLEVNSSQAGWLVLSDVWYPGWGASLDRKEIPIFHADYLFRTVNISAGDHIIIFDYHPESFVIGTYLSIFSIIIIIVWIGLNGMRKYRVRSK
jgi:uncharacterized membrane protein YfhO